MIACPHSLVRFLRFLAFVLAVLVLLSPQAQAGDLCKNTRLHTEWDKLPNSYTDSWAVVENAPFQTGRSPRARIQACLRNSEFSNLLGYHGSPFRFIIKVHVNGITYCPNNGYGYNRYKADGTGTEVDSETAYVSSSFGFDMLVPIAPDDVVTFSWDSDGVADRSQGCSTPRGLNVITTPVLNMTGEEDSSTRDTEDTDTEGLENTVDLPTVTIEADASTVEEGETADFTLTRTGSTASALTVNVLVTESEDMIPTSLERSHTVTFTSDNDTATLSLQTDNDELDELDSLVTATVIAQSGYTVGGTGSASVTVEDNNWPSVTIHAGPSPISEANGPAAFTLNRVGLTEEALVVNIRVAESHSMVDSRYTYPTTLTIPAGQAMEIIEVPIHDDTNDEDNSTITVAIEPGGPRSYTIGSPSSASVIVEDDDTTPGLPVVTIRSDRSSLTEGQSATLTLSRSGDTTATLDVTVSVQETGEMTTQDGTSTETFGVSDSRIQLTLDTVADDVDEPDSRITVTVIVDSAYTVGTPSAATIDVRDDDGTSHGTTGNPRNPQAGPGGVLPEIVILAGPSPVVEGTEVAFTLRRSGPMETALKVEVAVSESGRMLQRPPPAHVSFDAGKMLALLSVPTVADRRNELDSVVTARLRAASTYTIGQPGTAPVVVRDDDEPTGSRTRANDELLPRITQAMMSSTLSAISSRLEMAAPGGVDKRKTQEPEAEEEVTSIEEILISIPQLQPGESVDLKYLLDGKSFVLPLGADSGPWEAASLWVRGDYRDIGGGRDRPVIWDGDLTNAHMGLDAWLRPNLLAGIALSRSDGDFDFNDREDAVQGDYDAELTSLHPYLGWSSPDNHMHIWSTVGYGEGEVRIDAEDWRDSSDTQMMSATLGFSSRLAMVQDRYMPGVSTLRLKGEGNATKIRARGGEEIASLNAGFRRTRLALEGKHVLEKSDGRLLIPSLEVGFRHDRGDALTGSGIEVGTGVRYSDPNRRLAMEGRARVLIDHDDDYDEWGLMGEVRVDPTPGRHGLAFSLSPRWGLPSSSLNRLWAWDAGTGEQGVRPQMTGQLNAKLEYGLPALGGQGLWVPFADISLIDEGGLEIRLGSSLEVTDALHLSFEGGHLGNTADASGYGIGLWSNMRL
ncbi:MAG: autotransporter domain-containing protein [Proteobacteria bacterium]|nr:autotransporter domain-containing protein [Pseudomonadota bacterium]